MTNDPRHISLKDMISFIRVRVRIGGYSICNGVATAPAELMLNLDAILDAAERSLANQTPNTDDRPTGKPEGGPT